MIIYFHEKIYRKYRGLNVFSKVFLSAVCLNIVIIDFFFIVCTIIVKEVISTSFLFLIFLRSLLVDSIEAMRDKKKVVSSKSVVVVYGDKIQEFVPIGQKLKQKDFQIPIIFR